MPESRLLFDERPLVVNPTLAQVIGLNEAIILQQIHYWVIINQKAQKNFRDGYFWTYNTFKQWNEEFPFWGKRTIERTIAALEKAGLLVVGRFNKKAIDRTKWYRINYEAVDALSRIRQNGGMGDEASSDTNSQSAKMAECNPPTCPNAIRQNGGMGDEAGSGVDSSPHRLTRDLPSETTRDLKPPKLSSVPIFAKMQSYLGFPDKTTKDPIPNYGKEAAAIKRMRERGYSEEEVLAAWQAKVDARGGAYVSMVYVNEDIGKPNQRQARLTLPTGDDLVRQARERGLTE